MQVHKSFCKKCRKPVREEDGRTDWFHDETGKYLCAIDRNDVATPGGRTPKKGKNSKRKKNGKNGSKSRSD